MILFLFWFFCVLFCTGGCVGGGVVVVQISMETKLNRQQKATTVNETDYLDSIAIYARCGSLSYAEIRYYWYIKNVIKHNV